MPVAGAVKKKPEAPVAEKPAISADMLAHGLALVQDRIKKPEDMAEYRAAFTKVAKSFEEHGLQPSAVFMTECGFPIVGRLISSPEDVTKYGNKLLDYALACKELKFLGQPISEYQLFGYSLQGTDGFILSEARLDRLLAFSISCLEKEIRPQAIFKDGFSAASAAIKSPEDITEAGSSFIGFFEDCRKIARDQDKGIDAEYLLKSFAEVKGIVTSQEHLKRLVEASKSCLEQGGHPKHLLKYLGTVRGLVSSPDDITEYSSRFMRLDSECDKNGVASHYVIEHCFPAISKAITSPESLAKCEEVVIELARACKEMKADTWVHGYIFEFGFWLAKGYISSPEDAASYGSKFVELCGYGGGKALKSLSEEAWLMTSRERFDKLIDAAIALAKHGEDPYYFFALYLPAVKGMITSDARLDGFVELALACVENRVSLLETFGYNGFPAVKEMIVSDGHFNALIAACMSAVERKTGHGPVDPSYMLRHGFLVLKEHIKTPEDIRGWGGKLADLAENCKLAELKEEDKDMYIKLVFKKGLESIKGLVKSPEDIPKFGNQLIKLAAACHGHGIKPEDVFSDGLPAARELFTSEERFIRIMDACISLADHKIDPKSLLKGALPALKELVDSKERFDKFIAFTGSMEKSAAEHYLRVFEKRAGSDIEVLTGDAFEGYLSSIGGTSYQFLGVLYGLPINSLTFILDYWEHSPEAMGKVLDRSPELLLYHGVLANVGYDASEETAFLIKKGNKAEITRLALDLMAAYVMKSEHPADLEYLVGLRRDFNPAERIAAIDKMAAFTKVAHDLPYETRTEMAETRAKFFAPAPSASEGELRNAYPDVMDYLGRHPAVKKEEVVPLLSACLSFGKKLNLKTVNIEKQQLGIGAKVEIKEKYEKKFLSELQAAVKRARYDAFMEATDIYYSILDIVCDKKVERKGELPVYFKNALEGYFNVQHNKELMKELLGTYYLKGPGEAEKWISGLEGNAEAVKRMAGRGTSIDAVNKFKATYKVPVQKFQEKFEIRTSQVYSELRSLMHQLGYKSMKDLGIAETDDLLANGVAVAKELNQRVRKGEFSSDQKLIVDDINGHIENLKSALGQLHVAEGGGTVTFFVSTDPIQKLQMGVGFPSCLDITKRSNGHGAVARTIDANNVTLYAADGTEKGPIIGRVSLMESDKGFFVNSHFYENTTYDLFVPESGWIDALVKFSRAAGRDIMIVPSLFTPAQNMTEALGKAGFSLEKVKVHIDKAACDYSYSDLGFGDYIHEEGHDLEFEAYVLRAKA